MNQSNSNKEMLTSDNVATNRGNSMSIDELTNKVKIAASHRTHEERMKLLKTAHILDSKGDLDKRLSSKKVKIYK